MCSLNECDEALSILACGIFRYLVAMYPYVSSIDGQVAKGNSGATVEHVHRFEEA